MDPRSPKEEDPFESESAKGTGSLQIRICKTQRILMDPGLQNEELDKLWRIRQL